MGLLSFRAPKHEDLNEQIEMVLAANEQAIALADQEIEKIGILIEESDIAVSGAVSRLRQYGFNLK